MLGYLGDVMIRAALRKFKFSSSTWAGVRHGLGREGKKMREGYGGGGAVDRKEAGARIEEKKEKVSVADEYYERKSQEAVMILFPSLV